MAIAFQTMSFPAIVAGMINHARGTQSKVTDFVVGSKIRTLLESAAIQIDEFYQQVLNGIQAAIPVALYQTLSFSALSAVSAGGPINLVVQQSISPLLIPQGTTFTTNVSNTGYTTLADVTIAAGQTTGQVNVVAVTAGAAGNISAAQSFAASPTPNGFISATNPAAFTSGQDAENPAQTKARFAAYIATLSRATDAALVYGASQANVMNSAGAIQERVAFATVIDPAPPAGQGPQPVSVYVHNGIGGTSGQLVGAAQQIISGYTNAQGVQIPGYKAAGVPTTVYAAADVTLVVGGVVKAAPGYSSAALATSAAAALANYIEGLTIGQWFILAEAYALVMGVPGVSNWTPAGFTLDGSAVAAGDQPVSGTQKLLPGAMGLVGE